MEKKNIEIPFGAYDSELDGFEYIIPEGYEAEIKDGKVVVKKTGSEDEKIRNALIELVHDTTGNSLWVYYNVHKKDALAWLEKQGEHANFRDKIQIGDKVTRNKDGVLVNLSQLNRVAKKDEKQGKQKDILEDAILDSNKDGLIADTIRYKREKQGEQNPAETEKGANGNEREIPNSAWGEEDEEISKAIIKRISGESDALSVSLSSAISWVGNVKDRVQPQPKQKWSKEDEKMTKNLTSELYNLEARKLIDKETKDKYTKWLKSLRPQSKWKPSDEQMKALDSAIHCYAGISPTNNREVYALEIMKEQLKKLREEQLC